MQKSTFLFVFYFYAATILANVFSLPANGQACKRPQTPPSNSRGVNRLEKDSNSPLFRLDILKTSDVNGNKEPMTDEYKVQITAANLNYPYLDAKIFIILKGKCDSGELTFDTKKFFDDRESSPACPRVLSTNRKLPMIELPSLTWKPQTCGCVEFRAVVTSVDDVFYSDNEEVTNGPLTQTICVHKTATLELNIEALCQVQDRYSAAEIISRSSFLERHQLEARWMDKHGLEMALELRRSDNKYCCNKATMEAKLACFDDSRGRRVDKFCEGGYPDIAFTSFRVNHMREREKQCCYLLGEYRYACFAENSDLVPGPDVTLLDFSQDETDPVNDLSEFASLQDLDIVKKLRPLTFEKSDDTEEPIKKENDNDDNDDDESSVDDNADVEPQPQLLSSSRISRNEQMKPAAEVARSQHAVVSRDFPNTNRKNPSEGSRNNQKSASDNPVRTSSERQQKSRKSTEVDLRNYNEPATGRVVSNREITSGGRRASGERAGNHRSSAERRNAASEPTYPLYSGYSVPLPRKNGMSSTEKKSRPRGSAQRKQDWADAVDEPDVEDQGGKSVDEMNKLQKQMSRIRLRSQCCAAGVLAGQHVYGSFFNVRKECAHSGDKYIRSMTIPSGIKTCLEQFEKCCKEQAASGPIATSSEFKDNQFMYANNVRKIGSVGNTKQLKRKEAAAAEDEDKLQISRDIPKRGTLEADELETEKRYQSMRGKDRMNNENGDDDEEVDGPKRFDETDNDGRSDDDVLERTDETTGKEKDDEEDFEDGNDENDDLEWSPIYNQKKGKHGNTQTQQKNKKGATDQTENEKSTGGRGLKEDSLLAQTGGRLRKVDNTQAGGRSRNGKTSFREQRLTSRERNQYSKTYYSNTNPYKSLPLGKIGTQDSQEMAAAHVRKSPGALDSREMIEAHRKGNTVAHRKGNTEVRDVVNDAPNRRTNKKKKPNKQTWYYRK